MWFMPERERHDCLDTARAERAGVTAELLSPAHLLAAGRDLVADIGRSVAGAAISQYGITPEGLALRLSPGAFGAVSIGVPSAPPDAPWTAPIRLHLTCGSDLHGLSRWNLHAWGSVALQLQLLAALLDARAITPPDLTGIHEAREWLRCDFDALGGGDPFAATAALWRDLTALTAHALAPALEHRGGDEPTTLWNAARLIANPPATAVLPGAAGLLVEAGTRLRDAIARVTAGRQADRSRSTTTCT
jgi:hypothetical protein